MVPLSYDFAILGDGQPEGLLVAAGLARKGFSTVVIPSSALGELPPEEVYPVSYPVQVGLKRLDDLLFRAGFFRLEESGLQGASQYWQVVLPKNRLLFDGSIERVLSEVDREFPMISQNFRRICEMIQKPGAGAMNKAVHDLLVICQRDASFKRWLDLEMSVQVQPSKGYSHRRDRRESLRVWLSQLAKRGNKSYRVDPKLRQPFNSFLMEQARKWGVQVWGDPLQLKSGWGTFYLSSNARARHLIVNGLGGGRTLAKSMTTKTVDRFRYWLYVDRFEVPLVKVPEPLQEFCHIEMSDDPKPWTLRNLYTYRDPAREEASLHLGTWLEFDDPKSWANEIEKSRRMLERLIPFIPKDSFKPVPSLLELTEIQGDCVKRGQIERLMCFQEPRTRLSAWMDKLSKWHLRRSRAPKMGKRIYAVTPHYLPYRNRVASFEASLNLLDYFEHRRRRFSRA